jgi:hypothetical protein
LKIDVDYYKSLFGHEDKLDIDLVEYFWQECDLVPDEHHGMLERLFLAYMLKGVFQMVSISFFISMLGAC